MLLAHLRGAPIEGGDAGCPAAAPAAAARSKLDWRTRGLVEAGLLDLATLAVDETVILLTPSLHHY